MAGPPSSQSSPQLHGISDRELTEVQLHSVDSINDLHRSQHEHALKGIMPPRPSYTPTLNGNLYTRGPSRDVTAVNQRLSSTWQSHLQGMLTSSTSCAYAMACVIIILLLLTVFLIFYFLVQQGGAVRMMSEALREREVAATELSQLIQELQALRYNLTIRGGT